MQLQIKSLTASDTKTLDITSPLFDTELNQSLIHQAVTAFMACSRAGTKAQKNREEVSGGGIKPWRQKGTGRARAGSIRSPIWRKGGVTFAAKPRSYEQKINRKMYRKAVCSIFSELQRSEKLIVIDHLTLDAPKTKLFLAVLDKLKIKSALFIVEGLEDNLLLGARNIPNIDIILPSEMNPYSLLAFDNVVVTAPALTMLQEVMA